MQYLLLIYGNEAGMQAASKADVEQMIAAYGAYTQAMKKAGVMVAAAIVCKPSTAATTVRIADGKTKVLDGPYAETKEQLGGYYLIDVPDLDAALSWAARCPGASHGVDRSAPDLADVASMSLRDGERGRAGDCRGGGAPQLRQAGRLSRGAHARRRGGRGRAVRGLRRRPRRLADERHSRQSRKAGC